MNDFENRSPVASSLPERYDPTWFSERVFEDPEAFQIAYGELRRIAGYLLRGEAYRPTLQATELVNEAFLKLYKNPIAANDRDHLLALLSRYMRQILIDRARRRNADKRQGDNVTLEEGIGPGTFAEPEWELLEGGVDALREENETLARVFELHYFAGATLLSIAEGLELSERTIKRYWRAARLWLTDWVRREAGR